MNVFRMYEVLSEYCGNNSCTFCKLSPSRGRCLWAKRCKGLGVCAPIEMLTTERGIAVLKELFEMVFPTVIIKPTRKTEDSIASVDEYERLFL